MKLTITYEKDDKELDNSKLNSIASGLRDIEKSLHEFLTCSQQNYKELLTDLDSVISDLEDEIENA